MDRPAFDAPAADWLVYGDALQLAGDPRGELIGLVHGVAEKRTGRGVLDAYVRRHGKALFGVAPGDTFEPEWHFCLLRGIAIKVRPGQPDPVAPLLALDLARELRSITLVGMTSTSTLDLAPAMAAVLAAAPPTCTSFRFVDDLARRASMLVSRDDEPNANLVRFGSFAPFLARADHLAIETADANQLDLGDLAAEALRTFSLRCLRLAGRDGLEALGPVLAAARFAALTSFELRLVEQFTANLPAEVNPYVSVYGRRGSDGGSASGTDWSDLGDLFATLAGCPLERLALTSFVSGASLLEALGEAEMPESLVTLDLSDSMLDDDEAAWLVDNEIGGVGHLVLERTAVTAAGAARLRAAGYEVTHSIADNAPTWRYVVGAE